MVEIDAVDREILGLLVGDLRLSYRDIAKRLGVSHVNVSARVKRLGDRGVIRGYTVVVDPDAEGFYSLCLRISAKSGVELSEIGKKIAELPEVHVALRVSGECGSSRSLSTRAGKRRSSSFRR